MQSLRGHVLISNGGLYDPNFRHTVVLICEHDEDGALGVVLNRPADVAVEDAVPELAGVALPGENVYLGGPVQPQAVVVLADLLSEDAPATRVFGTVGLLTGEVKEEAVATIRRARVYAGYSGWGAGQLDDELGRNDWLVFPAERDDVFTDEPAGLWASILRRMGPKHSLLSRMPFDPSLN